MGAGGGVGGDELARFFRQMDEDGAGLGQDQAVIVEHGELVERADGRERLAEVLAGGVIDALDPIRQPHLLQRPLDAQVAGLAVDGGMDTAEGVEGDHGYRFSASPG